jgi:hypothetical protein
MVPLPSQISLLASTSIRTSSLCDWLLDIEGKYERQMSMSTLVALTAELSVYHNLRLVIPTVRESGLVPFGSTMELGLPAVTIASLGRR